MDDALRSLLEFLGMLAIVAGGVAAAYPMIGWIALAPGGVVLIATSWLVGRPRKLNEQER